MAQLQAWSIDRQDEGADRTTLDCDPGNDNDVSLHIPPPTAVS
jgi:hypothetical protein